MILLLDDSITQNTPGTRGGSGGRDRTLAAKRRKKPENLCFFVKKYTFETNFFYVSSEYPQSG